ncbi:hypothetical protein K402DRAFT_315518, partial [Aulographum hederae CBS 113979]
GATFSRKADCQRHYDCVHNEQELTLHPCGVKRCARKGDRGFKRKDHLKEHMRSFHSMDVSKRKPARR